MLTISISIASLLGFSILGYFTYNFRAKAIDAQVKFDSIKEFADNAAKENMRLDRSGKDMAKRVITLTNECATLAEKLTRLEGELARKQSVPKSEATVVTQNSNNKPAGKKRGPKPNRPNQAK